MPLYVEARKCQVSSTVTVMVKTTMETMYSTEIGKKAGLFAKLQPGRARKRINAT